MVGFEVFVPLVMSRMNTDSTASCRKRVGGEVRKKERRRVIGDARLISCAS